MIKAIIFDCFGVLTADNWHAFSSQLPEGIKQKARALNHEYDEGKITYNEFVEGVSEVTGAGRTAVEQSLQTGTAKNKKLLDYTVDLKRRGFKIGLISNVATNWIEEEFLTDDEQRLFDTMVLSYKEGVTKPHPNIYKTALEKLGVEPGQAVFIDDIDRYCEAAREQGMKAIIYKDFEQMKRELESLLANSKD